MAIKEKTLNCNFVIPEIGIGTSSMLHPYDSLLSAFDIGYRFIDTASMYGTEKAVARAIKTYSNRREDFIISTKIWIDDMKRHTQRSAIEKSLECLNTNYIDIYLIHWPLKEYLLETWSIIEEYKNKGFLKKIGLCNADIEDIEFLQKSGYSKPSFNQIEVHPYITQNDIIKWCNEQHIQIISYSPLAKSKLFKHPIIQKLSQKYKRTPAQIMLKWQLQRELLVIPKASSINHQKENIDLYTFMLENNDLNLISSLNKNAHCK